MYAKGVSYCIIDEDLSDDSSRIFLHQGRTDQNGGHHDWLNRMGWGFGAYHYHHKLLAHLHPDGICPYGGQKASIINPYTSKRIDLGAPYYYEDEPYFSLNLVTKALTANDSVGVRLDSDGTGGAFNACATADSSFNSLGEEFTFSYPTFLELKWDNTFFETDNGKLQLLCHTQSAFLDDIECYAYVSLKEIEQYMIKDGYFIALTNKRPTLWSFDYRKSTVTIIAPQKDALLKEGDGITVEAKICNDTQDIYVTYANLFIGQHFERKNILKNEGRVVFNNYKLTEQDIGNLDIEVEVGNAIYQNTASQTVQIQVKPKQDWISQVMRMDGKTEQEKELNKNISALNLKILAQGGEIDKLMWDQAKIDAVWAGCISFKDRYDIQVDPRLLISIALMEGTGSFDTSSENPALGGNGVETDFDTDLANAIDLLGGKIAAYAYFKDGFSAARSKAKDADLSGISDYDDILHYLNWKTPRLQLLSKSFMSGEYAVDNNWHKGVRLFYSKLAHDEAPADFTEYADLLGQDKIIEVANKNGIDGIEEIIKTVEFIAEMNGKDSANHDNSQYTIIGILND